MIKKNQKYLNAILLVIDIGIIFIALLTAYFIRFHIMVYSADVDYIRVNQYLLILVVLTPFYVVLYFMVGLYKPQRKKRFHEEFFLIFRANIMGSIVLLAILFIQKEVHYSRWVLVLYTSINIILTTLERGLLRIALKKLRAKGFNIKNVIIIGTGELSLDFYMKLKENFDLGYRVAGFVKDQEEVAIKEMHIIGNLIDIDEILKTASYDEAIIALPISAYNRIQPVINACEKNGIKAQIIPAYYKYLPAKSYIDQLDGIPLINVRYIPLENPFYSFIKRVFDISFSVLVILLCSPIFILAAIGVKLSSKGPVLFSQERIGLNHKPFKMYKFRSMKLQDNKEELTQWTTQNDPRKTKFGSFIRKTSIDELPQFLNVLKGDMSVIGPRPERPHFVYKFKEEIPKYMIKHHVRPGITGWAQVNGWRGDTSIEERIKHDIFYIENWTFGLDIAILFKTILYGFVNKNAY